MESTQNPRSEPPSDKSTGLICLGMALLCFASVPVFLKYFTSILDSWTVNGVRYTIGTLFWMPFVLSHRRGDPALRGIWRAAIVPAAINLVGQATFAFAPYYNDATLMSFVLRMSFLFTTVFGFWLLREERDLAKSPTFWIGASGLVLGVLLLYRGGSQVQGASLFGLTLLLFTSACWGLYSVVIRTNMSRYSVRLSFGVISLYTAVGLLIMMLVCGHWQQLANIDWAQWGWLVLSGLLGISFAHVLIYRAILSLGPIVTVGGASLVPLLTAGGAWLVLGERMRLMQWSGGAILLAGCFCLVFAKTRTHRQSQN